MQKTDARHVTYVHELFEQQVVRTPDRIALVYNEYQFTYQALSQRSNRLAHHLRQKGVRSETTVGIYVGNPISSVIGILGVLKAGGAYAPLNIDDPQKRIVAHLHNAQVKHVIVDNHSPRDFEIPNRQIINLDKDISQRASVSQERVVGEIHPKNLAYVIHTSGTTGEPKSVAMSHEAFFNLIFWHAKTLGGDNLRTLLFTPFSFDASNQELFSTICVGGMLYLIDDTIRHDPFELTQFIQEKGIGRLLLFFAPLQNFMIVANDQELEFEHLHEIITAGEPIKMTSQLLDFFHRNNNCRFMNMYGLSETHTVTCFRFPSNPDSWSTRVSIGFPISHTQIDLLDERQERLGIGQCGEIYVSGVCLARGYLNRPDLTAEKYLPFSFGEVPGQRACRTGDLGRRLADGSLECLGRRDHQVKIRGYRVELSEVEAAIARHACVNEVVVIARDGEPKEPEEYLYSYAGEENLRTANAISSHLVAYIVVQPNQKVTVQTLRTYLKEQLSPYMVPSFFVFLDKIPLSNNGKVDRSLLPSPKTRDMSLEQQIEGPRNAVEEVVLGLWSNVLDRENVGIHTNFFESGGDSLTATRLISEIRKLFQCELGVRSLFQNPTTAEFAKELERISLGHQNIHDIAKLILRVAKLSEEEVANSILQQS